MEDKTTFEDGNKVTWHEKKILKVSFLWFGSHENNGMVWAASKFSTCLEEGNFG